MVRVASRLHDVGMVAVTDGILLKPGPLTPEERREMQDHTSLGRAMLAGSGTELLDTASAIAWSHHERFDGGGYPCGYAGEQIPLAGRITAVADAFDAITTDRVYRPAQPVEQAVETLRAERERQFDPAVVDAFLASLEQALEIRARFAPPPASYPPPESVEDDTQVTLQAAARRFRSPPAGCGGGPTRGGSSRSGPPVGIAASRSRPSGGSPPSAACSRACGRSSRPASRCRSSRSS